MIISFVNQKGGVGKTTIAINLAAILRRKNFNLVYIDTDPQGSAIQWHAVEDNKAFEILHHPGTISQIDIEVFTQNYDHLVIDAPPAIGDITRSILAVSDLAIVPLSPSPLDIWSCWGTLEMITAVRRQNPKLKTRLIVSRKIPGTRVGREAKAALSVFNTDVFETELCQRVAYIDSMTSGVSVLQYASDSKASQEIESLCEEILPQMILSEMQLNSRHGNFEDQDAYEERSQFVEKTRRENVYNL